MAILASTTTSALLARFTWGDYICLSYTWGDAQRATIVVDGVAMAVNEHLEAALRDLRSIFECRIGMKVWADAVYINHADVIDRNAHILRMKDIFGGAFSVTVWTKEREDLETLSLYASRGEGLTRCEVFLRGYGRLALGELLGIRDRDWGIAEDEDEQFMQLVEDADVLVFDQFYLADSDDEDELGSCNRKRATGGIAI
ncbi:hypothetical protein B0O99DRAFT_615310 [Bisporella sp. PMI_857]|nr:hypothetical protein B0O99DRAFT_615310 [Bisporella sp. PMI_857]